MQLDMLAGWEKMKKFKTPEYQGRYSGIFIGWSKICGQRKQCGVLSQI
jgi:hypothetical protein